MGLAGPSAGRRVTADAGCGGLGNRIGDQPQRLFPKVEHVSMHRVVAHLAYALGTLGACLLAVLAVDRLTTTSARQDFARQEGDE